ncbi:PAS domain S-box protein [Dechloromonas denitrificans]|uniref:PAS domain S-box protein n=1 Tax=Dechloromonas denitrificans TaxID=281362 RepID=UPI001CFAECEF|nr:PAS domain S-box protein [Dechloromonas denitrificans]UCV09915.1 PAS domain S-box protein [Dechloromonas denitrificans]
MPDQKKRSRCLNFLLLTTLFAAFVVTGTAYTLWRLRAEATERNFDMANMYARSFEEHLTQSFNVINLTLANVANEPNDSALHQALGHAPYLRSLSLLDASDQIIASSDQRNIGQRVARRDFLPATPETRPILRAASPWAARDFHDGKPTSPDQPAPPEAPSLIPVLRDIDVDDARPASLLAAVNADYFLNYYERNLNSKSDVVELIRYDGILLLSTDPRRHPGTRIDNALLAQHIAADQAARFEQTLEDGRSVLTAYRPAREYPFAIVVHLDKEDGLASWRREAWHTLLAAGTMLMMALALASLYFIRLLRTARQHDSDVEKLRLRSAALEAAANSIIITDMQGNIEWANPAFCELSGYSMAETLGKNPRDLLKSGEQLAAGYRELWQTIITGHVWRGELINRRKDGTLYTEDQTITPVRDEEGRIRHFIAVKQDVTERKQAEQRMAELSHHLVVIQESACRRLAGELHDRTSPNLAAIGVHLDIMTACMEEGSTWTLSSRLDDVRALIEDTTASIREISSNLRPPVLDYAGLAPAVDSYLKQFQRRTGIAVQLICAHPEVRLDPEKESLLFRIVQESLTNCAKHSRAKSIVVSLCLESAPLTLSIADDGIGFDPDSLGKTTPTGGLGILTMREMAEFSGGRCTIVSVPGSGTRIEVEISSLKGHS